MLAHLFRDRAGRWYFSGYNACGDPWAGWRGARRRGRRRARVEGPRPPRPFDAVVRVPGDFIVCGDGVLYVTSGPQQFQEFTPAQVAELGRMGWLGFRLVEVPPAGGLEETCPRSQDLPT